MKLNRFMFAGTACLALGGLLLVMGTSIAGGEAKLMSEVDKIATALEKGDMAGAKKMAKKIADSEEEVYGVMLLFKPRNKKGYGVGETENAIIPDGIELKIRAMSRDTISAQKLKTEASALEKMAYRTASIALISHPLPTNKRKAKQWEEFVDSMQSSSMDLVKAIKSNSPAEVKKASSSLNASCNNCHSEFR